MVGGVGVFVGIKQACKNPRGKYFFDKLLLGLPILASCSARSLWHALREPWETLITSGVPILEGLSITARTSGNACSKKRC